MCPEYKIYVHLENADRIEYHTCFFRMDIYFSNEKSINIIMTSFESNFSKSSSQFGMV